VLLFIFEGVPLVKLCDQKVYFASLVWNPVGECHFETKVRNFIQIIILSSLCSVFGESTASHFQSP